MGKYHTLPVSLHLLLLLLYSAHPLPCQDVTLLPNGENQSHVSSLKAVCIDIASRFFKQRFVYTSACVRIRVEVGEERKKKEGGEVSDRLKLGTFVAARHFSRQPADMTAKAGER